MLYMVELWVELGWNYMKFHPNSTYNSTIHKLLIINMITSWRWKGGITNDKKYFSEKVQENILISVKKVQIQGLRGLLFLESNGFYHWLLPHGNKIRLEAYTEQSESNPGRWASAL